MRPPIYNPLFPRSFRWDKKSEAVWSEICRKMDLLKNKFSVFWFRDCEFLFLNGKNLMNVLFFTYNTHSSVKSIKKLSFIPKTNSLKHSLKFLQIGVYCLWGNITWLNGTKMPKKTCQPFCRSEIDQVQSFFQLKLKKKSIILTLEKNATSCDFWPLRGMQNLTVQG